MTYGTKNLQLSVLPGTGNNARTFRSDWKFRSAISASYFSSTDFWVELILALADSQAVKRLVQKSETYCKRLLFFKQFKRSFHSVPKHKLEWTEYQRLLYWLVCRRNISKVAGGVLQDFAFTETSWKYVWNFQVFMLFCNELRAWHLFNLFLWTLLRKDLYWLRNRGVRLLTLKDLADDGFC